MEQENYVSLWIGNIGSDDELEEYLELNYEDDENPESQFLKDFNISETDYDEDFTERIFLENNPDSPEELFSGCSYEDKVIPKLSELRFPEKRFNAGIMLYNFRYYGNTDTVIKENYSFEFAGCIKYDY